MVTRKKNRICHLFSSWFAVSQTHALQKRTSSSCAMQCSGHRHGKWHKKLEYKDQEHERSFLSKYTINSQPSNREDDECLGGFCEWIAIHDSPWENVQDAGTHFGSYLLSYTCIRYIIRVWLSFLSCLKPCVLGWDYGADYYFSAS